MKSFLSKPQYWFFAAIPVLYFSALLYETNTALDIQLHDTFTPFPIEYYYIVPCVFLFVWGVVHFVVRLYFKNQPHQAASLTHFVITFSLSWILAIWCLYNLSHPLTTPFTDLHSYMVESGMYIFEAIFCVFALTQVAFFIYLLVMLFKSVRK